VASLAAKTKQQSKQMTPNWLLWVMSFGATVGVGAIYHLLSQHNYRAAIWTGFLTGVVVLLIVALYLQDGLLRRRQPTDTANPSQVLEKPASEGPKVYLREKSPDDIVARIKSLNPLERNLVTKQTYVGRWVRWTGTILSIRPSSFSENGGFEITLGGGSFVYARLQFLPTERHLVEALQEGDLINYEAKIANVLDNDLYFTNVIVAQPKERTFVNSTPEDLTRVFEEHTEIQAKTLVADAIGKWMKVTGPLGNVGEFTSFSQVTFVSGTFLHPIHPTIYMYFRKKKWFDRISVLNRGNNITVVGRIREIRNGEIHLDNCELIDP
jgi:hypothetical protein